MHNINKILSHQPIMPVGVFDFALCRVHEIQKHPAAKPFENFQTNYHT